MGVTIDRDHASRPEAVSADVALDFVRRVHTRGGAWRLWTTGLLVSFPLGMLIGFAAHSVLATAIGIAGTALLVRNLWQNARALKAGRILALAEASPSPVAEIANGTLSIGDPKRPASSWGSMRVSAAEERTIRERALPVARLKA